MSTSLLERLKGSDLGIELNKLKKEEIEEANLLIQEGLARIDEACWKWGKRLKATKKAFFDKGKTE